jgi:hypothetical protein
MSNRFESDRDRRLRRAGDPNPDLTEFLWMSGGGVAKAKVEVDGTIKGVRLKEGELIEVVIRSPTR